MRSRAWPILSGARGSLAHPVDFARESLHGYSNSTVALELGGKRCHCCHRCHLHHFQATRGRAIAVIRGQFAVTERPFAVTPRLPRGGVASL